jgi:hypothetical protein
MKLSELTPEKLEEIYYAAYREKRKDKEYCVTKPVIQQELNMAAWKAVLDAMVSASDLEWAERYLAMRQCETAGG